LQRQKGNPQMWHKQHCSRDTDANSKRRVHRAGGSHTGMWTMSSCWLCSRRGACGLGTMVCGRKSQVVEKPRRGRRVISCICFINACRPGRGRDLCTLLRTTYTQPATPRVRILYAPGTFHVQTADAMSVALTQTQPFHTHTQITSGAVYERLQLHVAASVAV
jgi:hypothetical protein